MINLIKIIFEKLNFIYIKPKNFTNLKRKNTLKIYIFKSGTMGDHLLAIDSLNFLRKFLDYKNIESYIVCRTKSIFPDLINFGDQNSVIFRSHSEFIFKNKPWQKKNDEEIIFIDSEPNFRVGTLSGLFFGDIYTSTNYKFFTDKLYKKISKEIKFSFFNENTQEGVYISQLIIKLFDKLKLCDKNKFKYESFLENYKNTFIKQKKIYMDKQVIENHSKFLKKLNKKNSVYIYYGYQEKARHRLPSRKWLVEFCNLINSENNIIFVGGKLEKNIIEFLNSKNLRYTEIINKYSLVDWSTILTYASEEIPLISFDGGFSHLFGIHSNKIFQVFGSSNPEKWKNKSSFSGIYSCLDQGSPNYKPYKFLVPKVCPIAIKAWEKNNPEFVYRKFQEWKNIYL